MMASDSALHEADAKAVIFKILIMNHFSVLYHYELTQLKELSVIRIRVTDLRLWYRG